MRRYWHGTGVTDQAKAIAQKFIQGGAKAITAGLPWPGGTLAAPYAAPLLTGISRYVLGDAHADDLGLARDPFWDTAGAASVMSIGNGQKVTGLTPPFNAVVDQLTLQLIQMVGTHNAADVDLAMPASLVR